jgi:tetratricopeptide (TPR) repeat protein
MGPLKNYSKAEECFKKALKFEPNNYPALIDLGLTYREFTKL